MPRRQTKSSLPHLWLFTDDRVADEAILRAAAALPRGSGIVFRHYARTEDNRQALFDRLRKLTRRRGCVLLLAGSARTAARWGAEGVHMPGRRGSGAHFAARPCGGLCSASVHSLRELRMAERAGADLVFLSPVFPTRSHPGAPNLGPLRFAAIARQTRLPVVALGGMTADRFFRLRPLGACGWGAIDALTMR